MTDFLDALRQAPLLCDGAMGSLLFNKTGRLSEPNHVYEAFNTEWPELVESVHTAYLDAGARCLKTNTFGANAVKLARLGFGARVSEINEAGVAVARRCAEAYTQRSKEPVFVLASIGPLGDDGTSIADGYQEQLDGLLAAGPDALLLETFGAMEDLLAVLELLGARERVPPVIAELASSGLPGDAVGQLELARYIGALKDLGAAVVGVNCCAPWDAEEFVDGAAKIPAVASGEVLLSAMPNAGGFQRIGDRFMSSVNPEYMGKLARRFINRGVRLIGGCCEVHPEHIREMRNYMLSQSGGKTFVRIDTHSAVLPAGAAEKRGNGPFSRKLFDGEFAVSVEMLPPRGTSARAVGSKLAFIGELAASGLADAVDITDGSRGIPLMPPGDFAHLVRAELGDRDDPSLELIAHFTTRDLNVMGLQSRLVGYHWTGLRNVLFITGDPPKMSPDYPESAAVFDLDSVGLAHLTHFGLNAGRDFGGRPLSKNGEGTHFTIGVGFEPEALDVAAECAKLERKIENGADYVMTQPAFRFEPLARLGPYRARIPILVGVMVLTGLSHAKRVAEVPGVTMPDELLATLARYDDVADQAKAGWDFAVEQIRQVLSDGWSGLYLMSPASHRPVLDVLRAGLAG